MEEYFYVEDFNSNAFIIASKKYFDYNKRDLIRKALLLFFISLVLFFGMFLFRVNFWIHIIIPLTFFVISSVYILKYIIGRNKYLKETRGILSTKYSMKNPQSITHYTSKDIIMSIKTAEETLYRWDEFDSVFISSDCFYLHVDEINHVYFFIKSAIGNEHYYRMLEFIKKGIVNVQEMR